MNYKVIDPLFLDELKNELNEIRKYKLITTVEQKAKQFQLKLAKLTFFDPAKGDNFHKYRFFTFKILHKYCRGKCLNFRLGRNYSKT